MNGFCPTFLSYGFEDTEFAYRLHKQGKRFGILDEDVFHLYQEDHQSEYQNSIENKRKLMRYSAMTFIANHPNKEVYTEMKKWL